MPSNQLIHFLFQNKIKIYLLSHPVDQELMNARESKIDNNLRMSTVQLLFNEFGYVNDIKYQLSNRFINC